MKVVYPFNPIESGFRQLDPLTRSRTRIYGRINGNRVERIMMRPNFRKGTVVLGFDMFYFGEMAFYGLKSPVPTTSVYEEFDQNGKPTNGGAVSYVFNNYIQVRH